MTPRPTSNLSCRALSSLLCLSLLVLSTCQAASYESHRSQAQPSTTTMEPPIMEDSLVTATSESSGNQDDAVCFKCYDQVELAKALIGTQLDLVKKQNDLIRKIQKNQTPPAPPESSRRPKQPRQAPLRADQLARENRTSSISEHQINTRAWTNSDSDRPQVVVSTLRLARSTDNQYQPTQGAVERKNRIPALKQWENKRKQQLNETCKSLNELKSCLREISAECIGNLQYHSHEMFANQWHGKLHCPLPTIKLFANLIRSVGVGETKEPVARPISAPEETQAKLDAIFGSMNIGRLGVMLKPTLTRSATQKFNAMGQQEQQLEKGGPNQGQFKRRHPSDEVQNYKGQSSSMKSLSAGLMTSQLLLIPCLLVLLLALSALSMGRYFKQNRQKA